MSKKLTQEYIEEFCGKRKITLLSEYKNNATKLDLRCQVCTYEWSACFGDVKNHRTGCPSCAKSGFKPDKPAFVYYLRLKLKPHEYYKIGICHTDRIKRRMREIHPDIELVKLIPFDVGQKALDYEKYLHEKFAQHRVDLSDRVKSGCTEFFNRNVLGLKPTQCEQYQLPLF